MVDIDGQELQKSLLSSGRNSIRSMVSVRPGVGSVGEPSVCEEIENALVRVLLRSHKYETSVVSDVLIRDPGDSLFQSVRASRVIEDYDASVVGGSSKGMDTHFP